MDFSLYKILDVLFDLAYLALLVRVLLSWVPHNPNHPLIVWLNRLTEPVLRPFRNIVPPMQTGFDFSPIFAFLALALIKKVVFKIFFF
jgi:YggT family protein